MTDPDDANEGSARSQPSPAEILAPGPILAIGAFAVGLFLHWLFPVSVIPAPWHLGAGAVLTVLGLGVLLSGLLAMRRIGKSPDHEDEPSELITDGPFRYTRNPLYLGLVVIYLGLTAFLNSPWPVLPLVVLVWYFDRMAKREEAYLEAAFGDEFDRYAEDVRRWL